jgi:hypothetical protein
MISTDSAALLLHVHGITSIQFTDIHGLLITPHINAVPPFLLRRVCSASLSAT